MKKIIKLMILSLCVLSFAACGDSSDTDSNLKIVSSNINFTAAGGTGDIQVEATTSPSVESGTVTATADQPWCQLSVSGNKITVNVSEFYKLEGRSSLITIKCGTESTQVTATQAGYVFALDAPSLIVAGDIQHTDAYAFKYSLPFKFTTTKDWFTATLDGNSVKIAYAANTTGHPRFGYLKYECGTIKDSIRVAQYEVSKDIVGDYYFAGYTSAGQTHALNATITYNSGILNLNFPDYSWTLPLVFDYNTAKISICAGINIGTYVYNTVTYYIFPEIVASDGYYSWGSSVSLSALLDYDETEATTYGNFVDNGSFSPHPSIMYRFYMYKANVAASANRYATFTSNWSFYSPWIQKK